MTIGRAAVSGMIRLAALAVWVLGFPLLLDCGALLLALLTVRHPQKGAVLRQVWSEVWLLGYGADLVGLLWWFLGVAMLSQCGGFPPPSSPFWRLSGAAIAGVCLYFVEKHVLGGCELVDGRARRVAAFVLALITAPYFFLIL